MSTAYTPGLTVTRQATIRKTRRLPLKGEVLVAVGDGVKPDTLVARTYLPGPVTNLRAAEQLGAEPGDLERLLRKRAGEPVSRGEVLAETKSFFGLFTSRLESPVDGAIEFISSVTGNIGLRHPPQLVEVKAYIEGSVVEVLPGDGAVVETFGALVQGIFGVGGEQQGQIVNLATSPDEKIGAERIGPQHAGSVVSVGSAASAAVLQAALRHNVVGVVAGGLLDMDLRELLGYDLGVAITGDEGLALTVVITEGFGDITMAARTFELLLSLEGRAASISGATQIRAGVLRPEVIVPLDGEGGSATPEPPKQDLGLGTPIRLIREPHFGKLATVVALPPEPRLIETGAVVRVLEAELADGQRIITPRANVEIIES